MRLLLKKKRRHDEKLVFTLNKVMKVRDASHMCIIPFLGEGHQLHRDNVRGPYLDELTHLLPISVLIVIDNEGHGRLALQG